MIEFEKKWKAKKLKELQEKINQRMIEKEKKKEEEKMKKKIEEDKKRAEGRRINVII